MYGSGRTVQPQGHQITSIEECGALTDLPCFEYSVSLLTMPAKPLSELTQDEAKLLLVAAQMLGALGEQAVRPPMTTEQVQYWNTCMSGNLVHTHVTTISSFC